MNFGAMGPTGRNACVLDYSATVLISYFGSSAPVVIPRPTWWEEKQFTDFALKQFKGLQELGLAIDEQRLKALFPEYISTNLLEQPSVLATHSLETRAYIDIEGPPESPREVAAIFTISREVQYVFHKMLDCRRNTYTEQYATRHIHGIKVRIPHMESRATVL